jgi:O-antigen/teichoic acid export membrane protein
VVEQSPAETSSLLGDAGGLWNAFARGVRDNLLGEALVQVLRIGGMVLLARELAPADFGLLKVLIVVYMIATLLCEAGVPDALIQRKELTADHVATAWWMSLGLVSATVALLYIAAPLLAWVMAMHQLGPAIRLMCIPIFLDGTAIVPIARLSRDLKFGALATAEVLGEIAFIVMAIILLRGSYKIWTLPGGLAARVATHAVVIWVADHRIPWGRPRSAAAHDLGRFAITALGGRLITVASGNADFLLVGRLLGGGALGFYSMAWDLLRFVPDRLHRVVGRVAFPTFCRLQDDDTALGRAYCNFINYIARIVLPVAAGVTLCAPELLTTIYGKQWLPAAIPMRLLAIGLALAGLRIGLGAIYYTKNYPSMDIWLNGLRLVLIITAVVSSARIGLVGVAASVSIAEGAIGILGQYLVCALIRLRVGELALSVVASLRVTAVCLAVAYCARFVAQAAEIHGVMLLLVIAVPATAAFTMFEGGELRQIIAGVFGRMPFRIPEVET